MRTLCVEIMAVGPMNLGYLQHLFWRVSRNFKLFGRREREGWDNRSLEEGFSILNRKRTCSCLFYEHVLGEAHKGHEACLPICMECAHGHGDGNNDAMVQ